MRAVWYEENGAARDVLRQGDLPRPAPGQGEVLVRIAASGVNPSDVKRREGWRGQAIAFERMVPHNDGAGTIEAVGEGVDPARVGQRVWLHSAGWRRPFGTLADYACVSETLASRLPDGTSFEEGACLGVPAMTAHRLVHCAGPLEGGHVFVHGGAGSVGFYAVQLAKRAGARVATSVSSEEKAALAREAGADLVVDYRREDVPARVREWNAEGIDHVVDVDFAANLTTTLAILKPDNGSIATYASMADATPALPFYDLLVRNVSIHLVFVYEMPASAKAAAIAEIEAWLESGTARHLVAREFALDEAVAAHEAVEAGTLVGNAVVRLEAGP